jgi:Ulp1 family protease
MFSKSIYCFNEDLKGKDFKTLEYPMENMSYSVQDPGWLNDNIVDAYILLVEAVSKKGIHVQALNFFFYTCLKKFAIYLLDEEKWLRMIFERNAITNFEECDYILIPINSNDHSPWTTMVLDIWDSCTYYYPSHGKRDSK